MADDETTAEPIATQEWIGEKFGGKPGFKRQERADAKADLRHVQDPEVRDWRHDNPDADIHDWDRWVAQGRPRNAPGTPASTMSRFAGRRMGR